MKRLGIIIFLLFMITGCFKGQEENREIEKKLDNYNNIVNINTVIKELPAGGLAGTGGVGVTGVPSLFDN